MTDMTTTFHECVDLSANYSETKVAREPRAATDISLHRYLVADALDVPVHAQDLTVVEACAALALDGLAACA